MTATYIYRASAPATEGTVTHDGTPMVYAHSSVGGYRADGCRCHECTLAASWHKVGPTRQRVAEMRAAGVLLAYLAEQCEVNETTARAWLIGTVGRLRAVHAETIATVYLHHQQGRLPEEAYGRPSPLGARTTDVARHLAAAPPPPVGPAERDAAARAAAAQRLADTLRRANAGGSWRADAACLGVDQRYFFPVDLANIYRRSNRPLFDHALRICAGCTVIDKCERDHAHEVDGVWFGTTPLVRKLRREQAGVPGLLPAGTTSAVAS